MGISNEKTKTHFLLQLSLIAFLIFPLVSVGQKKHHRHKAKHHKVAHRHPAKKRVVVRTLPKRTTVVVHRKINYRFHNGRFYKPYNNGFVIVNAPLGIRIKTLPPGYRKFRWRKRHFFYSSGIYYAQQTDGSYEVINPEQGMMVDTLPEDHEIITEGDTEYLKVGNVYYTKVDENGKNQYKVAKVI